MRPWRSGLGWLPAAGPANPLDSDWSVPGRRGTPVDPTGPDRVPDKVRFRDSFSKQESTLPVGAPLQSQMRHTDHYQNAIPE